MSLVIGIDLGTSSTKTIALDESGTVLASASASYGMKTPRPGWVEQDASDWWRAICKTTRAVTAELQAQGRSVDEVRGVALSGHMNGAVFVDGAGNPLRSPILWLDRRSQAECNAANARAGDLLRARALHVMNPINTLAKVLWVRAHEREVYEEARYVLIPKDWVRFRMTGTFGSDVSDASVSAAADLQARDWSGEILDALEVRRSLFPDISESPEVVGALTGRASRETGLAAKTPVCAGGGDVSCLAVGSGVIRPGIVNVGIGTAGHALAFAKTLDTAAFNRLWPVCHSVPGAFFWLGCSYTCGASMAWLSTQLGEDVSVLTRSAAEAPAGSEGLFFLPWLEGAATPHPDAGARGGWIGLTLRHSKAHLVRSLMEGVAFDLRRSLECFEDIGLPIEDLRISEGGAKSSLWRQIQADVFGRDARVLDVQDASALGAAVIAGVGVGVFPDFETACERAVGLGEAIRHSGKRATEYEKQFQRYRGLYPSLKGWFNENTTTGP